MEVQVSFSQFREDVILLRALRNVRAEDIFYIDVGAFDAVIDSVTYLFYLRGGHGINIEPQIEHKRKYVIERPRDISLFAAVSDKMGETMFYGRGQSATLEKNGKYATGKGKKVRVVTLNAICKKHLHREQDVHFLKIDVEGHESRVLKGLDLKKVRPWIICIEAVEPGCEVEAYSIWEPMLLDNGYTFCYSYGVNRYYCARERTEEAEFLRQSDLIDNEIVIIKDCRHAYELLLNSRSYRIMLPFRKLKAFLMKGRE